MILLDHYSKKKNKVENIVIRKKYKTLIISLSINKKNFRNNLYTIC